MAGSAPTLGLAVVFDAEEWRLGELFDERGELMMINKGSWTPGMQQRSVQQRSSDADVGAAGQGCGFSFKPLVKLSERHCPARPQPSGGAGSGIGGCGQ